MCGATYGACLPSNPFHDHGDTNHGETSFT